MERVLSGLQPERYFYYFEEISRIPRSSYEEQAVSNYIVEFAKARGLEYSQDADWNVIINKPATPGYEDHRDIWIWFVSAQRAYSMIFRKIPLTYILMEIG